MSDTVSARLVCFHLQIRSPTQGDQTEWYRNSSFDTSAASLAFVCCSIQEQLLCLTQIVSEGVSDRLAGVKHRKAEENRQQKDFLLPVLFPFPVFDSCKSITDPIRIQCVSNTAAAPVLQPMYAQAWHRYGYHVQVVTCNLSQRPNYRCIDRLMVGATATGQTLPGA